ncbi:MAG: hypothetical protein HQL25_06225 [Candidatus Omnitrophica bacterium]|nr:hypothetical protein [Candidatus Omnitrophota bacterium]
MARNFDEQQLLQLPEVIEEIKRHLWIESEKKGFDLGFEKAKQDWLDKYADGWVAYFRPDLKKGVKPPAGIAETSKPVEPFIVKKRSAKAYL